MKGIHDRGDRPRHQWHGGARRQTSGRMVRTLKAELEYNTKGDGEEDLGRG